jgi:chemotaxis protein MotB
MKRKPPTGEHLSRDRWLVSYADFVTLLFAFFVVMYATAQLDQKKAGQLSVAIEAAFEQLGIFQPDKKPKGVLPKPLPGSRTARTAPIVELSRFPSEIPGQQAVSRQKEDFTALRAELEAALAGEIKRNEVSLRTDPNDLVVSLRELGFFDSGSATMKATAQDAFARVARILQ